MIESYYWKKDLLDHAKRLKPVKNPNSFSERLAVNFEKEIIISFFLIRKLFEEHRVSSKSTNYKAEIYSFAPSGKNITKLNQSSIDKIYNLDNEKKVKKKIVFLANQLIHSCTIFAYRKEDRNWGGVYATSDFERNKNFYRIPIEEIISIFKLVGNDYPTSFGMKWNKNIGDYDVFTN